MIQGFGPPSKKGMNNSQRASQKIHLWLAFWTCCRANTCAREYLSSNVTRNVSLQLDSPQNNSLSKTGITKRHTQQFQRLFDWGIRKFLAQQTSYEESRNTEMLSAMARRPRTESLKNIPANMKAAPFRRSCWWWEPCQNPWEKCTPSQHGIFPKET